MRKSAKIALWSVAAIALAAGSSAAGFYAGIGVGSRTMGAMAETNEAHDALSEVRSVMVALDKRDMDLSQRQLAINLRAALSKLGALQIAGAYARCTETEKDALARAADYVTSHSDRVLPKDDPFLLSGAKFCMSGRSAELANGGQ